MLRWKKGQAVGGNYVSVGGHQGGKTAKNGLGNGSSSVSGSVGGSDGTHTHALTHSIGGESLHRGAYDLTATFSGATGNSVVRQTAGTFGTYLVRTTDSGHGHSFSQTAAAQTVAGDNETRPTNRGVKYIIKM